MARPTKWVPEEDVILLDTAGQSAEITNARLVEAGFEERAPRAIIARRAYLHKNPVTVLDLAVSDDGDPIGTLSSQRSLILREIKQCEDKLAELHERYTEVETELMRLLLDPTRLPEDVRSRVEGVLKQVRNESSKR